MAKVIIVLISVPFVLVGAESLFGGGAQNVAKINGQDITVQELEEQVFLQQRQLLSRMGDQIDPSILEANRLREQALQALLTRTMLLQYAEDNGMTIAEVELNRMIMQNPEFHVDGRFSRERYVSLLNSIGMTPGMYKRLYRTDLLRNQLASGIADTGFVTDAQMRLYTRLLHQTRDIRYIALDIEKARQQQSVTHDQARAFYEDNPQYFTSEEKVIVDYIELRLSDFYQDVSEQAIRAAYEDEISRIDETEQRQVSHILLQPDSKSRNEAFEKLESIRQRLKDGESFSDLARSYSEDTGSRNQGGFLGELVEDAFPPAFVEAARQLDEGEVSAVVETEAGLHLVRLEQLQRSEIPEFESRRETLAKELKEAEAVPRFWSAVEQLKDISFNAMDLSEPARQLAVEIKQSEPFTRQGGDGVFANSAVYRAAFSDPVLKDGFNSEVLELSDNHVLVMHLHQHQPQDVLPFAEVSAKAHDMLATKLASEQLQETAQALLAELQQGAEVDKLAREHDLDWQVLLSSRRQVSGKAAEIVDHAFTLPRPGDNQRAIDMLQLANGSFALITVDRVRDGNMAVVDSQELDSLREFFAQADAAQALEVLKDHIEQNARIRVY